MPSVRAEGEPSVVGERTGGRFEDRPKMAGIQIPKSDLPILRQRSKAAAIGGDDNRFDLPQETVQAMQSAFGYQFPNSHSRRRENASTTDCKLAAVGRKSHDGDVIHAMRIP